MIPTIKRKNHDNMRFSIHIENVGAETDRAVWEWHHQNVKNGSYEDGTQIGVESFDTWVGNNNGKVIFYCDAQKDALYFKLTWGGILLDKRIVKPERA